MSKKVYCIAGFKPKPGKFDEVFQILQSLEPQTTREDGCIQYVVTKQFAHPLAPGTYYPIVFNEIWASQAAFETHCARDFIANFFQNQCLDKNGLIEDFNVCVYSDE